MRVLLLAPSPVSNSNIAGTELMIRGLARTLLASGVEICIAGHAATNDIPVGRSDLDRVPVYILPPLPRPSRTAHFAVRNPTAPGFLGLIEEVQPDIVQIHGLTANAFNRRHIEIAKAARVKTVLWHNVPGITCLQRGLLFEGGKPCDGQVLVDRCTRCRLHSIGVPRAVAAIASLVDFGALGARLPDRIESLLGARQFTAEFKRAVEAAFGALDAVRVGAQWAYDVLRRNGVPEAKLFLIRPGVDLDQDSGETENPERIWQGQGIGRPTRLIYWGRIHRSKGVHTVIEALALRPDLAVELVIFGHLNADDPFVRRLQEMAARDPRIRFMGGVTPDRVLGVLRKADLAIIPSRWLETGPLTVFEAQAAGLPIIGSDRGGIAELCSEETGARIFPAENANALAELLEQTLGDPSVLPYLRKKIPKPRTMADVTAEVRSVYRQLLATKW